MKTNTIYTTAIILITYSLLFSLPAQSQAQEQLPVREYTNPDEMVTFDRSVEFARALDVINEFAQQYGGKVIIDRTDAKGSIGIAVPPMHWKDALALILRVNNLRLIEQRDFYEIVLPPSQKTSTEKGSGTAPVATTSTREVRINAIFFEGSRRALQEVGVDWSTLTENVPANIGSFVNPQQGGGQGGGGGGNGGGGGQGGQGNGQLPAPGAFDGPFVQVNQKGAQSVSQNVFNSLVNFGEIGNSGIQVQALFSAFEADNLGEILASPSIKVMDGEEGRIQVGQDFSIKQRDFAGNVIDQFFSVGTILTVTPQVVEQNDTTFIHLVVEAERSSAQPDPVSTIINKQQATTQSVLLDGEATVIAGLYRTESAEVRRGIPILKDLPSWFFGLRYLFGYNSKDYQMRELVVLIQATIEPTIPERYAREDRPDKFDLLNKRRQEYRKEIYERENSSSGLMDLMRDKDRVNEEKTQKKRTVSNQEETKKPEKPVVKKQESKPAPRKEKEEVAQDPEMTERSVPLNFFNENEEEKREKEKEAEAAKDEADKPVSQHQKPEPDASASSKDSNSEQAQGSFESPKNGSNMYYIIGGSFKDEVNANLYRNELIDDGYNAEVISKGDLNYYFVIYDSYSSLAAARAELDEIKNQNSNAWVYRFR